VTAIGNSFEPAGNHRPFLPKLEQRDEAAHEPGARPGNHFGEGDRGEGGCLAVSVGWNVHGTEWVLNSEVAMALAERARFGGNWAAVAARAAQSVHMRKACSSPALAPVILGIIAQLI
jgi:hypothetical protein